MSQVCRMLMQHLSPPIVICVHGRSIFDPRFQNVHLSLVSGGPSQLKQMQKGAFPPTLRGVDMFCSNLSYHFDDCGSCGLHLAFWMICFSHFSAWIRTHHLRNPNPWYRLAKKKLQTKTIKHHQSRHMLLSYICIQIYFRTPRLKPSLSLFPVFPTISRHFKLRPFRLDLETSAPLKVLKAETARVLGSFNRSRETSWFEGFF